MTATGRDPCDLELDELRAERARLQAEEHAVSYVRRLVQGRLDLVRAEQRRRREGGHLDLEADLSSVLGSHVLAGAPSGSAAGSARPPREVTVPDDHPLLADLDERCERLGLHDLTELDDQSVEELATELDVFEHACSAERRALFQRIDALTAELVHRYRNGGASVDTLLGGGSGDQGSDG
jgi:hypothetical protein